MSMEKSLEQRLDEGTEIKETISRHQIAFAFIKPDFMHLLPQIEEILKENNLDIIYRDKIRLQKDAIEYIYRDDLNDHFYPVMEKYLLNNDVIVMLVTGNYNDPAKILLSLKTTKDGKDGIIREKFQKKLELSSEEIELWKKGKHPHQEEVSILLTQQNVIHTAENSEEAVNSLKKIIGPKFEEMEKRGNLPAELWRIFEDDENTTITTVDTPITDKQLEAEARTVKTVENIIEVEGAKKEEEKVGQKEQKEEKNETSEQDNSPKK